MHRFSFLFFVISLIFIEGFAERQELIKRKHRTSKTTSIVIPCVSGHFQHLFGLLKCYQEQTRVPDEIVISLCETSLIDAEQIDALEDFSWPFKVKIIRHPDRKSAGENRNIACANATGDILLCQDADDIPHPERVEIVKYIFDTYVVDHLIHKWNDLESCLNTRWRPSDVSIYSFTKYKDVIKRFDYIHNGNVCFSSKVAKKIRWEQTLFYDRDIQFNERVYEAFEHNVIVPLELILYRMGLSAFGNGYGPSS